MSMFLKGLDDIMVLDVAGNIFLPVPVFLFAIIGQGHCFGFWYYYDDMVRS